jgi:hypothetical protein
MEGLVHLMLSWNTYMSLLDEYNRASYPSMVNKDDWTCDCIMQFKSLQFRETWLVAGMNLGVWTKAWEHSILVQWSVNLPPLCVNQQIQEIIFQKVRMDAKTTSLILGVAPVIKVVWRKKLDIKGKPTTVSKFGTSIHGSCCSRSQNHTWSSNREWRSCI